MLDAFAWPHAAVGLRIGRLDLVACSAKDPDAPSSELLQALHHISRGAPCSLTPICENCGSASCSGCVDKGFDERFKVEREYHQPYQKPITNLRCLLK